MRASLALLVFIAGCGGGGGAEDSLPPTGSIVFPPRGALTEALSVAVTGTAADDTAVASVNVGFVEASTDDGFRTWRAEVPLARGVNVLAARAADGSGNLAALPSASVTRTGVVPAGPTAVALAPDGRALVLDVTLKTLFLVDLATGDRDVAPSMGPSPAAPSGLAVDGARALLCDVAERALVAFDLATGQWTVLSDDLTGSGPILQRPQSLALLPGGRVAIGDAIAAAIVVVDLADGDRTTLSALTFTPVAVAHDAFHGRLLVLGSNALAAVDMATGAVTFLSTIAKGTGPPLQGANAVACDPLTGIVYVTDGALAAVLAVDPATGNRAAVSDAGKGSGTPLSFPRGIALQGGRLLVTDSVADGLFSVDRATGERQLVSVAQLGAGAPLLAPRDVATGAAETLLLDLAQGLVAIDGDGDRRLVSGPGAGSGPAFVSPLGLSAPRDGKVLVADGGAGALFEVDLATGARAILSDGFLPTDAAFLGPRVLALDSGLGALVEVDPATGSRSTIATGLNLPRSIAVDLTRAFVVGTGLFSVDLLTGAVTPLAVPGLLDPKGVAYDAAGQRLFVTDDGADTLVAVPLADGTPFPLDGDGPRYAGPNGVAFDAAKGLVFVADSGRGALFAVEPVSGARVIVSK